MAAGFRGSILPIGRSASPFVGQAGLRSLFAFWLGGAEAVAFTPVASNARHRLLTMRAGR